MYKVIKSRTKKLNSNDLIMTLSENKRILILAAVFAVGMVIGAGAVKINSASLVIKLLTIFNNYRDLRMQQSLPVNFCNSFINAFSYLVVIYCAGLCAVGYPVIYAVLFVRGFGIGMVSGYLYNAYMIKGVGYSMLILFPGVIFYVIIMLLACNEGMLMSKEMLLMIMNKKLDGENSFKYYCVRFLIFSIITAFGALVETFFFSIFSCFFDF